MNNFFKASRRAFQSFAKQARSNANFNKNNNKSKAQIQTRLPQKCHNLPLIVIRFVNLSTIRPITAFCSPLMLNNTLALIGLAPSSLDELNDSEDDDT